jgi:hypothetical protein
MLTISTSSNHGLAVSSKVLCANKGHLKAKRYFLV